MPRGVLSSTTTRLLSKHFHSRSRSCGSGVGSPTRLLITQTNHNALGHCQRDAELNGSDRATSNRVRSFHTRRSRVDLSTRVLLLERTSSSSWSARRRAARRPFSSSSSFRSEADFHAVADETLETIQDAMDDLFEETANDDDDDDDGREVVVASGVLTLRLGGHGTWVVNKQTPNRQLWWSSPLSGPRRYEYDVDRGAWTRTRDDDGSSSSSSSSRDTLGDVLRAEIRELYGADLDLDV